MDEMKAQQMEALQTAIPYCEKIATALDNIMKEYTEGKLPDTEEYLTHILNGLNWIFEVYNGTMSLVNEGGVAVDKDAANKAVIAFNDAKKADDDAAVADALKGIHTFVKSFEDAAKALVA